MVERKRQMVRGFVYLCIWRVEERQQNPVHIHMRNFLVYSGIGRKGRRVFQMNIRRCQHRKLLELQIHSGRSIALRYTQHCWCNQSYFDRVYWRRLVRMRSEDSVWHHSLEDICNCNLVRRFHKLHCDRMVVPVLSIHRYLKRKIED